MYIKRTIIIANICGQIKGKIRSAVFATSWHKHRAENRIKDFDRMQGISQLRFDIKDQPRTAAVRTPSGKLYR